MLIEAALKPHMSNRQISELYTSALSDPAMQAYVGILSQRLKRLTGEKTE